MTKKTLPINFHSEGISFILKSKTNIRSWLGDVIVSEKKQLGEINYIFCNDKHLLTLNKTYLNHNTLTDIITFDYSEKETISGDIFISIERVKENALQFDTGFDMELRRVMVHGVLHLIGFKDKSKRDKDEMTQKEDYYLGCY